MPTMAEYARTVVARKARRCEDSRTFDRHTIPVGAPYARCVLFPDGDLNQGTRPWTVAICSDCYCRYGATMPDPKPRRRHPR
jgi:hypothetical protein